MYTLYYSPGACSLAVHTILNELDIAAITINKDSASGFNLLNPAGTVPVLQAGNSILNEGAAIILHLLNSKPNHLFPLDKIEQQRVIEKIMFANATMHPAYGRLFFGLNAITGDVTRREYESAAADKINSLWKIVNDQIGENNYLMGDQVSAADIMLTVYASWGEYFDVNIELGENTERMIRNVRARPSFQKAVAAEQQQPHSEAS